MAQALFARIRRNPRIGSEGPCYPAVLILGRPSSHPGSAARLGARRWLVRAAMALAALAALGLAVLALSQIDVGAVATALAGADPALLGVAVGAYLVGQTLSGAMWATAQRAGGVRGLSLSTALGMHWVARGACELLPASMGEAVRVGLVRRHPSGAEAGAWRIAGGVAGYKLVDAAVTGIAVLAIALVTPMPGPAASLRWTALGAIGVVAAIAVVWRRGGLRPVGRLPPGGPRAPAGRLGEGAGVVTDGRAASSAAIYGLLAALARILSLGALLAALGVPVAAAGLAFTVIVLAGIIPGAPGGAGARELVLVPALALAHGVPAESALAFSLMVQVTALATTLVAAAIALAWLSARRPEAAVPEPVVDRPGHLA
jgi:uncharacterized membrane protein YbhN (UPF0104 family)